MPYLRFTRDRGGYETTTLLHTHGRGGKGQPRVLYYFRTPPNVRVGRSPIDEDAIRLLEEHNPEVEFDWTRILKTSPTPAPEDKRESRKDRGHKERKSKDQRQGLPAEARGREAVAADRDDADKIVATDHPDHGAADLTDHEAADHADLDDADEQLSGLPADALEPEGANVPPEHTTPAAERLGAEGLARLRARYAEVMARIAERPLDEAAQEQLKLQAERLNPDVWVTAAEVAEGLEQYESVFESLRAVVGSGHRRRRRRR